MEILGAPKRDWSVQRAEATLGVVERLTRATSKCWLTACGKSGESAVAVNAILYWYLRGTVSDD
jgi:hypothetical protein